MIIFSMWCPFSVTFHYCSAKSLKQWLYLVSEVSSTGQAEIKAPHKQNRKAIGFSPLPCFTRGHWLVTFKTRQTGTQTITPHLEREKLDMFLCSACFVVTQSFESRQMHTEIDGQVSACVCVCVYIQLPPRGVIYRQNTHTFPILLPHI